MLHHRAIRDGGDPRPHVDYLDQITRLPQVPADNRDTYATGNGRGLCGLCIELNGRTRLRISPRPYDRRWNYLTPYLRSRNIVKSRERDGAFSP